MKKAVQFLFCSIALIFSSCSQSNDNPNNSSQIFRACLTSEPFSLHPAYGYETRSQLLIRALFEGLTRIGADGNIYPALAETISISEDKKTYTFTLRESVWSNGEPVVASDLAYAWKNVISSDSGSSLCDLFYLIKNAKAIKEKLLPLDEIGIEVLDQKTLQVELEHPASYFLHLLANPIFSPVCQKIDQTYSEWHLQAKDKFVCNGPFKVKKRNDAEIIMEKNPLYHDADSVKLSEAHIHFISDPYTALLMYEKGEIDWVGEPFDKIPLEAMSDLIEKKQLNSHPIAGVYWLLCNTEEFPLNSINIRKSLAYGINRKELTDSVLIGHKAAFSVAPDMLSFLDVEDKSKDLNIEQARKFFQAGLAELGITEEEFPSIEIKYTQEQKALMQVIQEQWRKNLGINVKLQCLDWNLCFQYFNKKKFQIGPIGWVSFFEDPIYHFHTFRQRSNSSNWCSWENEEYHHLLDLSDQEIDDVVRKEELQKAEKIILEEMPVIPLYYLMFRFVNNERVHHAPITDLGEFDLKWVYLE